jgi:hypothetical protein
MADVEQKALRAALKFDECQFTADTAANFAEKILNKFEKKS